MNVDQKLAAIRDLIQQDIGNRGLARDPHDNLLTATCDDFVNACRSLADQRDAACLIGTGFFIPDGRPPAFETDGPLGGVFLARALRHCDIGCNFHGEDAVRQVIRLGLEIAGVTTVACPHEALTHLIVVERAGPAADGNHYTMRGLDISPHLNWSLKLPSTRFALKTIGIGDGGNEMGMGKIPHETIVKNITNGELVHCRVATDHLIVAGVSNWGSYALGAGVALLRDVTLPRELFDPLRERQLLQVMVEHGPLVDGVTGKQTATVDGLAWDDYIRPLVEIGRIVRG